MAEAARNSAATDPARGDASSASRTSTRRGYQRLKLPRRSMQGPGIACIDLIEDRMRSRLVGISIIFAMLLTMSAEFMTKAGEPDYILADKVLFASAMPDVVTLGPSLTSRPPAVQVLNTNQVSFVRRTCPAVNATECETNSSYDEPVFVSMVVKSVSFGTTPKDTLDCRTKNLLDLRGTLEGDMIKDACTPVLKRATNSTRAGLASLESARIVSGPRGIYALAFDAGDGAVAHATTTVESKVVTMHVHANAPCPTSVWPGTAFTPQPKVQVLDGDNKPLGVGAAPSPVTPLLSYPSSHTAPLMPLLSCTSSHASLPLLSCTSAYAFGHVPCPACELDCSLGAHPLSPSAVASRSYRARLHICGPKFL